MEGKGGRSRSCNWTTKQELQLYELCKQKRAFIEGKFLGPSGGKQKREQAWEEITASVNAHSLDSKFNTDQVNKKYQNLKSRFHNKATDLKRPATGGGPPHKFNEVEQFMFADLEGRPNLAGIDGYDTCTAIPLQGQDEMENESTQDHIIQVVPFQQEAVAGDVGATLECESYSDAATCSSATSTTCSTVVTCSICKKTFSSGTYLKIHEKTHSISAKPKAKCTKQNRSCDTANQETQLMIVEGEKLKLQIEKLKMEKEILCLQNVKLKQETCKIDKELEKIAEETNLIKLNQTLVKLKI